MTDSVELWRMHKKTLANMERIVDALQQGGDHVLVLNTYQAVNLFELFCAMGIGAVVSDSPIKSLNTGDWAGEIRYMIQNAVPHGEPNAVKPNKSAEEQAQEASKWCQWRGHEPKP